ncbi:MAG: hypothetical protein WDA08_08750, partial [Weeksellaceae bacterium]
YYNNPAQIICRIIKRFLISKSGCKDTYLFNPCNFLSKYFLTETLIQNLNGKKYAFSLKLGLQR